MAFRFYLDGQLTDQPMNDMELSSSVVRDKQQGNLTITQDVELQYNGNNEYIAPLISGYSYLYSKFFGTGCDSIEVEIYDDSVTPAVLVYKGLIKIPSIKIDLQRAVAATKIQDNGFYSFINNNRNVPVDLSAIVSKSGNDVTPINLYQLDVFNSVTGVYYSTIGSYRHGYKVYDAFDIIIRTLSDNTLTFQSNFLSNLTDVPFLCDYKGLRFGQLSPSFDVDFDSLFNEMNKIYNLFYYIDDSDVNNPIFKIESYADSFGNGQVAYAFTDIKEMDLQYDISNYYSNIQVGSQDVTTGTPANYPFTNEFLYDGWNEKTVFPKGQCNVNNSLDLVSSFVIHNNSIQDVIIMQTDDYQDKLFLIACDNVDDVLFTAIAKQYDPFLAGDTFYNIPFNNFNKLANHSARFTSDLASFLSTGDNNFRALMGSSTLNNRIYQGVGSATTGNLMPNVGPFFSSGSVGLDAFNETTSGGFDNGGNYSTTLFEYTIPADGNYSFGMQLLFETTGMTLANEFFKVEVYNNLGLSPISPFITYFDGSWVYNYSFSSTFTAGTTISVGYIITYYYPLPFNQPDVQNGRNLILSYQSFYECNGSPTSGIVPYLGDENVKKYIYQFDYEIPQSDYLALKPTIFKLVSFEKDGVTKFGWIDNMKRNDWTGITQVKLITNNAATSQ